MVPFFGTELVRNGALVFAVAFEAITCFFRFVLKKESTKNTGFIGLFTGGLRIHHGYVGVALVLARNLFPASPLPIVGDWQQLAAIVGWGCVLSDGIHHFWVLWPFAGTHDFDLVYPRNSFPRLARLEARWRGNRTFALVGIVATATMLAVFILVPR